LKKKENIDYKKYKGYSMGKHLYSEYIYHSKKKYKFVYEHKYYSKQYFEGAIKMSKINNNRHYVLILILLNM